MTISTNGTVLTRLAGALYNTQMSNATYKEVAALDPSTLANVLYSRDFNTVPDATVASTLVTNLGLTSVSGLSNWIAAQLTSAGSAKGAKIVELLNGFAQMSADATYGTAATAFNTKVNSSLALSQSTDNQGGTFDSISTAVAAKTFTLTASSDVISGTAGNDTINGVLQAAGATGTTVAPGDVVNGGAGTDTLSIAVAGALGADYTLSAIQTNGVEKVLLNNFDTAASNNIVDTALMTGLTTVGLSASDAAGDTIFTGMTALVGAELRNGAGDLTLTYNAAAVAGTADTQAVTVSNVSAGTFTADGAETIAITSELAKSTLTNVVSNSLKTITVAGAADLTISTALTAATINAAAATGAVTVTLGSATQTVTTGSGNDTIDAAGNLTSADTINGGVGTDTLKLTSGNATVAVGTTASKGALFNVSGIEIIDVAATADTAVLDLDNTSGVSTVVAAANVKTVVLDANAADTVKNTNSVAVGFTLNGVAYTTAAADGTATSGEAAALIATKINTIAGFSAVVTTAATITITATTGEAVEFALTSGHTTEDSQGFNAVSFTNIGTQTIDVYSAGAVTAGLKDPSGTADVLNINLKTLAADKGFNHSVGTVTANLIETINLGVTGMTDLKVTTVGSLDASAIKTLNITGDSDLTISAFGTAVTTIDGSTSSGDLNLAAMGAAKDQSIKTGSGNDTIAMGAYLTAADTIDGGANNTATGSTTIGTDKLTATGNFGTVTTAAALKIANVENIEIATGGTAATYIDATAITGASNIAFSSTGGAVTLSKLAAGTKIGLGIGAGEAASTFDLSLADATGAADSITVDFSDSIDAGTSNTLTIAAAVETLNISASKTETANLTSTLVNTGMAAKNIVVTDGADVGATLALGTLNAATTSVDASKYAGKLTATTAATGAVTVSANGKVANSVTTGAGADTITLAGNLGTTVQTIAGGTGNDILNVTVDNASSDFTSVSAVETINITVGANKQAGVADGTKDDGLNLATSLNILGGDALSTFKYSSTGVITDAGSLTSVDASGFNGAIELLLDANALDANMTIKGGALLTDKVTTTVSTDTTGEVVKSMTGVETLVLNSVASDSNARIDLANVTGLTNLETTFTGGGTLSQIAVDKLASGVTVKFTGAITSDNLVIDLADKAAADNSLTLELTSFAGAGNSLNFDAAGLETLNISAKNTNAGLIDLGGVAATSSTGTVTVNVSGTGGVTLKSLSALTNVVNASTATGAIVLASGDRAATAMTITTGEAGDTVAMRHANDVLNGGLGTDTLVLTPNFVLGGVQVDLSSATDQVTTFNGSANAAAQIGFENVDLSGVTGTFGADITAIKTGSIITGTANADQITGGAGADTINYATTTSLFASNTSGLTDAIIGGGGTDTLSVGTVGTAFAIAVGNSFANATTIEKIVSVANSAAVSITLHADAATAGIHTVDLSAAVTSTGHKIDVSAYTALGTTLIGSSTVLTTIIGGAGADTITGGAGADVIKGGAGADRITVGGTATEVVQITSAAGATGGDSGTYTATTANTVSTSTFDKISGMAAGDTIKLLTAYTGAAGAAAGLVATSVNAATLASATLTLADNSIHLIRGTYTDGTNTFVGAAAGLDSLLIYDADATLTTLAYEAVVLIGYNGGSASTMGGNAGVITLGTAA